MAKMAKISQKSAKIGHFTRGFRVIFGASRSGSPEFHNFKIDRAPQLFGVKGKVKDPGKALNSRSPNMTFSRKKYFKLLQKKINSEGTEEKKGSKFFQKNIKGGWCVGPRKVVF